MSVVAHVAGQFLWVGSYAAAHDVNLLCDNGIKGRQSVVGTQFTLVLFLFTSATTATTTAASGLDMIFSAAYSRATVTRPPPSVARSPLAARLRRAGRQRRRRGHRAVGDRGTARGGLGRGAEPWRPPDSLQCTQLHPL